MVAITPRVVAAAAVALALAVCAMVRVAEAHTTHICLGQDPSTGRVAFFVAHWHGAMPAVGFLRVRVPLEDGSWGYGTGTDPFTDYPFTRSVRDGVVMEDEDGGVYNPGDLDHTKLEAAGYTCLPFNGGASYDDMFWDYAEFGCCEGEQLQLYAEFPASFAILAMSEPGGTFTCPAGGIGTGVPPTVTRDCSLVQLYTAGFPIPDELKPNSTGRPGGGCPTACGLPRVSTFEDVFTNKTSIVRHWTTTDQCDGSTTTGEQPIHGVACTPDICGGINFVELNVTATYYSLSLSAALEEPGKLWCGVFNVTEEQPTNATVLREELGRRGFAIDVPTRKEPVNMTIQPLRRVVDYEVRCVAEDRFGTTLCYNASELVTLNLPEGPIPPPIFNVTGGVNFTWDLVDGDFVDPGVTAHDAVTGLEVEVTVEPYAPPLHVVGNSFLIKYSAWDISGSIYGSIVRNVTFWASHPCHATYGAQYRDGICDRVECPGIWEAVDAETVMYNCSHQHTDVNKTKFGDTCRLWCGAPHLKSANAYVAVCGADGSWHFGVPANEEAFAAVVEETMDLVLAPSYYPVFDELRGRYGVRGIPFLGVDGMEKCYTPCYIDGVAYNHTDPHPSNPCLRCNSRVSFGRWTVQPRLCRHAFCDPLQVCPVALSCEQDLSGVNPSGDATPRSFVRAGESIASLSHVALSTGPTVCGSAYLDYPWPGGDRILAERQAAGTAMPAY